MCREDWRNAGIGLTGSARATSGDAIGSPNASIMKPAPTIMDTQLVQRAMEDAAPTCQRCTLFGWNLQRKQPALDAPVSLIEMNPVA